MPSDGPQSAKAARRVLDCGIAYDRIAHWLDDELAIPRNPEGCWTFDALSNSCSIQLTPLGSSTVGPLSFERTELVVEGDAACVAEFYRLFTLRFISAGG